MCKCCQSCFDSCYWHCFGKWSFDENIAAYEDPFTQEKDNRSIDNLAFWDSVAVIANRNVVTIQPLPDQHVTDYNTHANKQMDEEKIHLTQQTNIENNEQELKDECKPLAYIANIEPDKVVLRKKSTMEEKCDKQRSGSISQDPNRKKSLKERRKSAAGLTLKLENDFHEIPVIRQSSVPKFYLDTPEMANLQGSYGSEFSSSVLTSPVLPNSPNWTLDLRSVVQIEKEHASHSKPVTPKTKRLTQVRKKLIPILHKKPSTKSLPDSINHI